VFENICGNLSVHNLSISGGGFKDSDIAQVQSTSSIDKLFDENNSSLPSISHDGGMASSRPMSGSSWEK